MDILTNSNRFYNRDFSVVLTTIWLLTTVYLGTYCISLNFGDREAGCKNGRQGFATVVSTLIWH